MLFRALLSVAVLATGCGLVDSDVSNFDISLPQKTLTVDSAQWQLTGDATLPAIPCTSQMTCDQGIDMVCAAEECSSSCVSNNCQLGIDVGLFKDFSLKDENPALQELDDRALISVSVSRIFYEVSANTLSVDTPQLDLYLAPATVMDPDDPSAAYLGSIPVVPAQTTVMEGELDLDPNGEEAMRSFLEDWTTPFNVILVGTVTVSAGDTVPTGKLDAAVRVNASAGLK